MKNMVEKLKTVVGDVKTAADNVASGSQQLSAGVRADVPGHDRAGGLGGRGLVVG